MPSLAVAFSNLGLLRHQAGRSREAEEAFECSVEIGSRLFESSPENVEVGRGLAGAFINLGSLRYKAGRSREAEEAYERSVEISRRLFENNPENVEVGHLLALTLNNLAQNLNSPEDAEQKIMDALRISRIICDKVPDNIGFRLHMAMQHTTLGNIHEKMQQYEEQEMDYLGAVQIFQELRQNASQPEITDMLATALHNLGVFYMEREKWDKAEDYLKQAVDLGSELYREHPEFIESASGYAMALGNLGLVYENLGQKSKAAEYYSQAIDLGNKLLPYSEYFTEIEKELAINQNRLERLSRDKDETSN